MGSRPHDPRSSKASRSRARREAISAPSFSGNSSPGNISVELIDLRTINPLDRDAIVKSVSKTGRCVIVQEAPKTAGMASEIATQIMEYCFLHLKCPVQRVCGFDTMMPYYKLELEYLPDAKRIAEAIEQTMAY